MSNILFIILDRNLTRSIVMNSAITLDFKIDWWKLDEILTAVMFTAVAGFIVFSFISAILVISDIYAAILFYSALATLILAGVSISAFLLGRYCMKKYQTELNT
jgi:hypothetical protein